MIVVIFVYLLAMVCWLGAVIFFSFFTAPVVFTRLPVAEAGKVISTIFPRYYLLGEIAGAIALLIAIYMAVAARGWWLLCLVTLAAAFACTLYAGLVLQPRVDAIRTVNEQQNPDPAVKAEFDRMHRLSVTLNGAVLLLDVIALFGTAAALVPRG